MTKTNYSLSHSQIHMWAIQCSQSPYQQIFWEGGGNQRMQREQWQLIYIYIIVKKMHTYKWEMHRHHDEQFVQVKTANKKTTMKKRNG